MLTLALLGLGWLGQGAERPELPRLLRRQEDSVEAWEDGLSDSDLEIRAEAASLLLGRIGDVRPAERLEFLMACAGGGFLPSDLGATFRALSEEWDGAQAAVGKALRSDPGEDGALLRGALIAAGAMELASPEVVEGVAARLRDSATAGLAREALFRITRHEFPDWGSFGEWWQGARESGREAWLLEAMDQALEREIALWKTRLAADPGSALDALLEPISGVRRLGYEGLRALAPGSVPQGPTPEAEALVAAFHREPHPGLRRLLVTLIPRFLAGADAVALLDQALESRLPVEREEAARALQLVRPVEVARGGLLRHLGRVYLDAEGGPGASPAFRLTLWAGLVGLSREGEEAGPDEKLETILLHSLSFEEDPGVRGRVYEAAGVLGSEGFHGVLLPHVLDEERTYRDRRAALDALTSLALSEGQPESLLEVVAPLLNHPQSADLRYAAVVCLQRLQTPGTEPLLLARLKVEPEEYLQNEILKGLRDVAGPDSLEPLLEWVPSAATRSAWVAVLGKSLGVDLAALEAAAASLGARADWATARSLVDGFPREGLDEEGLAAHDRLTARTLSLWLLSEGVLEGREAFLRDASGRLGDLAASDPSPSEWFILRGRVDRLAGEASAAFSSFRAAVAAGVGDALSSVLTLAADAAEQAGEGPVFLSWLDELAATGAIPNEAQLRSRFADAAPAEGS